MAELTDAAIDQALERGRLAAATEPRAASARYDAANRRVLVDLANGCTFAFPADLATLEILGNGYGLHWPPLDTDLAIPDLMAGLMGARSWMARRAGRATSEAKATASRNNGRKGGRPRKRAEG